MFFLGLFNSFCKITFPINDLKNRSTIMAKLFLLKKLFLNFATHLQLSIRLQQIQQKENRPLSLSII